jgi:glycosyltransferase involved in cell wall biosynthesis
LSHPNTLLPRFDLVVPVYNEEAGLPEFFFRLDKLKLNCQPIFVDNASSDNSLTLLKNYPNALVIEHAQNEGYGGSLIDGMAAGSSDYIVVIDADCEYPPESIPALVAALEAHSVVYASRFLDPALEKAANMSFVKTTGNRLFSYAYNSLFHQNTTDLYTGCKGLHRSSLNNIKFEQKGFEHVTELAVKLAANGHTIFDIPIQYEPRATGSSKMRYIQDGAKFLKLLSHYYLLQCQGKLT